MAPWHIVLLIGSLFWGAPALHADESNASLSGKIEYTFTDFPRGTTEGETLLWNELFFSPRLKLDVSDTVNLVAEGIARENFDYQRRSLHTLREAYTQFSSSTWDMKAGKQIITWGQADAIKPADYFKVYDYTDLLRAEDIGIVALKAGYYYDNNEIEFVWSPLFEKHRVSYDPENPWAVVPRTGVQVMVNDENEPQGWFTAPQMGIRSSFTTEGFDYSFLYIYGRDRFPTFFTITVVDADQVETRPFYQRIHVVGFEWVKVFTGFNFKGEVTYTRTEGSAAPDASSLLRPFFKGVFGVEKKIDNIGWGKELYVLAQFAVDTLETRGDDASLSLNHFFKNAFTLNVQYKASEFYRILLKGAYFLPGKGHYLEPEVNWKPRDDVTLYLTVDVLDGKKGSLWERYRDNDRLQLGLRYDF